MYKIKQGKGYRFSSLKLKYERPYYSYSYLVPPSSLAETNKLIKKYKAPMLKLSPSNVSYLSSLVDITPKLCTWQHFLSSGFYMIPHPDKIDKGRNDFSSDSLGVFDQIDIVGGEDACFTTFKCMGVADGVGGWTNQGIDPAIYARKLMQYTKQEIESKVLNVRTLPLDPFVLLNQAYSKLVCEGIKGSSTACIIVTNEKDDGLELSSLSVGDSRFVIIRGSEIIFSSSAQQHHFNYPYQLGDGSADKPESGLKHTMMLQAKDIIVLGTDGLFDNLFDEEILDYFKLHKMQYPIDPTVCAKQLALLAKKKTEIGNCECPFVVEAAKSGFHWTRGKPDDITVVVGQVIKSPKLSL